MRFLVSSPSLLFHLRDSKAAVFNARSRNYIDRLMIFGRFSKLNRPEREIFTNKSLKISDNGIDRSVFSCVEPYHCSLLPQCSTDNRDYD